ncbi:MAG TPA: hypothetical protein VKY22_10635 [Bradyrhizobium sp.]|nr:hypothetical protein [Bradyrhizobium sp.]
MHQAELRPWTRVAFIQLSRRSDHRLQALAIQRPGPDLPAVAQDVDAVRSRLTAASDQLQQRLCQTAMIDGKLLIQEVIAQLRQRPPIPVSNFQLQQPHAALNGTKSFPPVNAARWRPRHAHVDIIGRQGAVAAERDAGRENWSRDRQDARRHRKH